MPTVAACLITKNEASHIADCLTSLAGHVDEIVLVDTGSTDETVAIAETFDCRVFHHPWRDDFSAARNHGLDRATAEWILYIDADERLSTEGGPPLNQLIPGRGAAAARLRFYPRPTATAYFEYRLFRNDPRIRFTGAMHETMLPGIRRVCEEEGAAIEDLADVVLTHHGYEGDLSAKHARNLPLLEAAIEADPRRVYLRFHLGFTLNELARYEEAVEPLSAGIELAFDPEASAQSRVEGSMCANTLCEIRLRQGRVAEALQIAERGLTLLPDNLPLQVHQARALLLLDRGAEAATLAVRFLDWDSENFFDGRLAYPRELLTVTRFGLLGDIHFALGENEQAAGFYDRAARAAAEPQSYRAKAGLARARARGAQPAFRT